MAQGRRFTGGNMNIHDDLIHIEEELKKAWDSLITNTEHDAQRVLAWISSKLKHNPTPVEPPTDKPVE